MFFTWGNLLEKGIKQYKLGHVIHVAIWILTSVNSWRSESSNISLVVLNKLLFAPSLSLFTKIAKSRTDGTTDSQYLRIKSPRRRLETALGSTHLTKKCFSLVIFNSDFFILPHFGIIFGARVSFKTSFGVKPYFVF